MYIVVAFVVHLIPCTFDLIDNKLFKRAWFLLNYTPVTFMPVHGYFVLDIFINVHQNDLILVFFDNIITLCIHSTLTQNQRFILYRKPGLKISYIPY